MLSESTENREMSAYDNMCVLIDATLVARVVPSNSSTSSYTNKKIFLRKTVGEYYLRVDSSSSPAGQQAEFCLPCVVHTYVAR